ncbi:hypothetical protein BJV78DRAFT_1156471 [Lactifluus subvellereus]|nr:hypothetical protein BJV78DRAFT_1156471 [Lactifluus subvellereus]
MAVERHDAFLSSEKHEHARANIVKVGWVQMGSAKGSSDITVTQPCDDGKGKDKSSRAYCCILEILAGEKLSRRSPGNVHPSYLRTVPAARSVETHHQGSGRASVQIRKWWRIQACEEGGICGPHQKALLSVKARVLGGILVASESACVELQIKNRTTKKTTGLHVTLSRQLHLPTSSNTTGRKTMPPLQISDTLASIAFRGPEYVAHLGTKGIAQLMFDVPHTARTGTISVYPQHGGDGDEGEEESDVHGVVAVGDSYAPRQQGYRAGAASCSISSRFPGLPPPPPEPYLYPAPDPYADVHLNHSSSASLPPPGLVSPTSPMPYADSAPLTIVNVTVPELSTLPSGLPVSGTPDRLHPPFPYQQQQYAPLPEQATGHGTRAAHLLAPKPMPSPKIITETQSIVDDDDPFRRSFGKEGTRTRSLSVVKLEVIAARVVAEMQAEARAEKDEGTVADKTLPVPLVPSGKQSGYGRNRRLVAQEIFQQQGHVEEEERREETEADSRSRFCAHRHAVNNPYSHHMGCKEKRKAAWMLLSGTWRSKLGCATIPPYLQKWAPFSHPYLQPHSRRHTPAAPSDDILRARALHNFWITCFARFLSSEPTSRSHPVNESAISSRALGAEEDFGGRKANLNTTPPSVEGEGKEEAEAEDADADGRTQRQGKGAGASSGSERRTHKARSRKSAKLDSKEKDGEKDKEWKGKRWKDKYGDDGAARRLRRAAKGRVAEWLMPEPEPEPEVTPEVNADQDRLSPPKLAPAPPVEPAPTSTTAAVSAYPTTSRVVESEPNPRSSGFIPVSTLRRAPISLPPASGLPAIPTATHDVAPALGAPVRRFAHKYPANLPVEVKYDVKSARGGRGRRVTAVASIWAEAANAAADASKARGPSQRQPPGSERQPLTDFRLALRQSSR